MILAAVWRVYPLHFSLGRQVIWQLDSNEFPITARDGSICSIDIASLHLRSFADNRRRWSEGGVELLQNGVALKKTFTPHIAGEGLFYHQDDQLLFIPRSYPSGASLSNYSIRYLELTGAGQVLDLLGRYYALAWLAGLALTACMLHYRRWDGERFSLGMVMLVLGLLGSTVPRIVHNWDRVVLSQDTGSYVQNYLRPPLYPTFIKLAQGDLDFSAGDFADCDLPLASPGRVLLRITHAQKIVFYLSLWFMLVTFVRAFPYPPTILFFFLMHYRGLFNQGWCDYLLSEALTASLIHLLVAAFLGLLRSRSCWYLPLLALPFTAMVLARSAAICCVIILAGGVVLALVWHWRRKARWLAAVAVTGFIGAAGLGWLLVSNYQQNHLLTVSPLKNWERFAFALQCADSSDVGKMRESLARDFLKEALQGRCASWAARHREDTLLNFDLNLNCWMIGHPLANRLLLERGRIRAPVPIVPTAGLIFPPANDQGHVRATAVADCKELDHLFESIADPILARHSDRYLALVRKNLADTAQYNRLRVEPLGLIGLSLLALLGAAYGRNALAAASLLFLGIHIFNLVIVSVQEQPMDRYVQFTEWLWLIGFWFAGLATWQRRFGPVLNGSSA
jgi:hypothetical protein